MKAVFVAMVLWQGAAALESPVAEPRYFQYRRAVTTLAAGIGGQACATLDGAVYAHSGPSLKDLRLYDGMQEMPYAITLSESAEADSEPARVSNLGVQGGGLGGRRIVFDLAMPDRAYTDVGLDLDGQNFIASAEVSGTNKPGERPTRLGTFTLFDLSAQHLSRSTTLHLQESSFHTLHVELSLSPAAGAAPPMVSAAMVKGASVPPSREAQTVYTTVGTVTTVMQRGQFTVASFRLPAHVPVERISFVTADGFGGNFSRDVRVTDRAAAMSEAAGETQAGTIFRVRVAEGGWEIRQQQMSVPATLGANLQKDAVVEVSIDNGNDRPLPLRQVSLEMRQRRLCFGVPADGKLAVFYGDAALAAPVYDFARVLSFAGSVAGAELGAEQQNPAFTARPVPERPLTERHPELLWVALLAVVCILAVVATHSAKRMPR